MNTHKLLCGLVALLAIGNVVLLREVMLLSRGADNPKYFPVEVASDLNNAKDTDYGLRGVSVTTLNNDGTVLRRLDQLERKLDSIHTKISMNTKIDAQELFAGENPVEINEAFRGASDVNIPADVAVPPMLKGATIEEVIEKLKANVEAAKE